MKLRLFLLTSFLVVIAASFCYAVEQIDDPNRLRMPDICHQLFARQLYNEAIEECTKQLNEGMWTKAKVYLFRGLSYQAVGKYDNAIEDFSKVIELIPQDYKGYYNRANVYFSKEEYDNAVKDYEKVIELIPGDYKAYYNMAALYSSRNNAPEACQWFKKAIEKGMNDWGHIKQDKDMDAIRNESCYNEVMSGH